jgi:hypothetical protein
MAVLRNDVDQVWDADGNLVSSVPVQRDVTVEVTEADLRANPQAHIDALLTAISALSEIAGRTNATINANPAAAIKDTVREVLTVARRTVRLARLQLGVLDSTDTGG